MHAIGADLNIGPHIEGAGPGPCGFPTAITACRHDVIVSDGTAQAGALSPQCGTQEVHPKRVYFMRLRRRRRWLFAANSTGFGWSSRAARTP